VESYLRHLAVSLEETSAGTKCDLYHTRYAVALILYESASVLAERVEANTNSAAKKSTVYLNCATAPPVWG
jgi:hypothetical protein